VCVRVWGVVGVMGGRSIFKLVAVVGLWVGCSEGLCSCVETRVGDTTISKGANNLVYGANNLLHGFNMLSQ
jgi:hypothetical protein